MAAHYTSVRGANFAIYLPEWLAKHNKVIFETIYPSAMRLQVCTGAHRKVAFE
jgi:hypothetical protein